MKKKERQYYNDINEYKRNEKMSKYERKNREKRLIRTLIILAVLVGLFFGAKAWVNETKRRLADTYNDQKDFFTSEEFKSNAEERTKSFIDKILDFIKGGAKKTQEIGETASSVVTSYVVSTYNEAKEEVASEHSNEEGKVNPDFHKTELWCVVDGDTLMIKEGSEFTKVRLLCINTPESVAEEEYLEKKNTTNNEYGKEASRWLEKYVEDNQYIFGVPIYLEYDESTTDVYGRTLAYVWLKDDVDTKSDNDIRNYMLNAIMVEEGFAKVVVYEPNHKYADYFKTYYEEAKRDKKGLWQHEEFDLFK